MVLENHLCVPPTPAVPQWHEDPVVAVEAMVRVTYRHVRMNNTHNRRRTRRCVSKSNELMSR
jgi:hypothetical protein